MTNSVTIVDYGIGNILSVKRAFEVIGSEVTLSADPKKILDAERIVVPGVGAFGAGIGEMRKRGLFDTVQEFSLKNRPLLGICLGAQMLLESSEEDPEISGLGLIPGNTVRVPSTGSEGENLRIPIVGWYPVVWSKSFSNHNEYFYLIHSYHAKTAAETDTVGTYEYGGRKITAVIQRGHILGYQFHPEKSARAGLSLLKKFMNV